MTPTRRCPIRKGDACTLCVPGVSGPQDCGLVYLVMTDPDLRDRWRETPSHREQVRVING